MSIDDIYSMWDGLPSVFDTQTVPGTWETEWSFGVTDPEPPIGLTAAPTSWLDFIVLDGPGGTEADAAEARLSNGPLLPGDQSFGGAPVPRDPSQQVPPPDTLGFYLPFHYYYPDWWGVYILAEGVTDLAVFLWSSAATRLEFANAVGLAYRFIYRHEAFHHCVEAFASRLEVTHRKPVFKTSVQEVKKRSAPPDPTDEALASAYALAHCSECLKSLSRDEREAGLDALRAYIRLQPPPYDSAIDFEPDWAFKSGRDGLAEEVQRRVTGGDRLPDLWGMFGYAFAPFATVKSRVHFVVRRGSVLHQRIRGDDLLKYRVMAKRLKQLGCREVRSGKGSERIWEGPHGRQSPIKHHGAGTEIAPGSLRGLLRDLGLGLSLSQFDSV